LQRYDGSTTPSRPHEVAIVMGTMVGWCVYFFGDGRRVLTFLRTQVKFRDDWRSSSEMWEVKASTVSEIAAATGFSRWRVSVCLRQLEHDGLAAPDGPDRWSFAIDY
jgi:hypothetical protein